MKRKITASFVSLGCFKNLVDTEVLGGMLESRGVEIVSPYEKADWMIINTCGFVRDAKEESIEEVLVALEKKESGVVGQVAVTGCLTQRYAEELKKNFKDVDIMWGVNHPRELADMIAADKRGQYKDKELFLYDEKHKRVISTTPNSTFIKISEGCDMKCSFCAIPQIRGPYRSRQIPSILEEAEKYRSLGFQEINLISQNSTYFGKDRGKRSQLPELLEGISALGFDWVRVLYLMPEEVDDRIIEAFSHPSILPYFDLPFQHVSAGILKDMNRGGGMKKNLELIEKIRRQVKDAVIRSTFMVGFPGESEKQFEELKDFAERAGIERFGVFGFSPEENTAAFDLKDKIPDDVISERAERLLDVSDRNLEQYNRKIVGSTREFLPIGPCPWDDRSTIGRIESQAPEVDGLTQVKWKFDDRYRIYRVKITGFENEILNGEKA